MTLAEAGEIFAHWVDNPPVHLMVQIIARMLGWKPPTAAVMSLDDIAATAPPGLVLSHVSGVGMPPPILDVEALRARNRTRLANRAS